MNMITSILCLRIWNCPYDSLVTNFRFNTRNMIHITIKLGKMIMIHIVTEFASARSNSCPACLKSRLEIYPFPKSLSPYKPRSG